MASKALYLHFLTAVALCGCTASASNSRSQSPSGGAGTPTTPVVSPLTTGSTDTGAVSGLSCDDRLTAGLTASCALDWDAADARFTGPREAGVGSNQALPGDLNADGIGDVLLGETEPTGDVPDPAAYVILGPPAGASAVATAASIVFTSDPLYVSMAQPAGDTNGDGAADLWVPGFDLSMHLFLGPIPAILDPAAAAASVALESYRNWSLADLNGDGSVDALFADTQFDGAYLVPGPLTGALDATDASFHLQDSNCENVYAEDLGDTDGDGVHEIYIGVPASGYCYGSAQVGTIIAADYIGENELNGFASATARVVGGARHVRAAGDLNGDGNADVAIVGADPAAGVTVVFGPVAGDLDPSSVGDVRWTHPTAYPYDAVSVGDLDADGLGELAVLYFDNQTMEFNVYVVPGGRTGTWDVTPEWTLVGGARHVNDLHLSAGDVDGDGISDLVASVPGDVIFASLGVHY